MRSLLVERIDARSIIIIFALVLGLTSYQNAFANDTDGVTSVNFYQGDFESAKNKAGNEGKLFFIDFYASWCMPCKWMDQTTFNDQRVANVMNENFVAIKVDIDQVEGFEMKNKYEIQYLPTMLIFNSQGKLIDRIEETLPANRLLGILQSHNNDRNKVAVSFATNTAPGSKSLDTNDDKGQYLNNKELMEGYALYNENKTFRLQMGVFDSYENAFTEVNALKSDFIEPIIVLNDFYDGGVRYKIMMGEFASMQEAEGFRKILERDFNRTSIIQ